MNRDLVIVDTETTGLDATCHEVIDIWALRIDADRPYLLLDEAGGLVIPKRLDLAHPMALKINGFEKARWDREARPWSEVWQEVLPVMAGATIVGSNPAFDIRFIEEMCDRYRVKSPHTRHPIDTCSLAQPLKHRGQIRSCSLGALCEYFDINGVQDAAHTAKGDVYRTLEVYRRLVSGLHWQPTGVWSA